MKIKLENIILSLAIILIVGAIGIQNSSNLLYNGDVSHITIALNEEDGVETTLSEEPTESENSGLININTATKEELMELDGVGEVTADSIILYRENKKFETIDEIKNVDGIGEKKFEKISDNITV